MPLNDEQRMKLEDTIMDLHFTSQKYIESQKDIHKKLLEVNIQEAIEILQDVKDDIQDDVKKYDYKLHMFLPMQIYELVCLRERNDYSKGDL